MTIEAKSWTDKRMQSLPATCAFTGKEVTVKVLPRQPDNDVLREVVAQIDNVFYYGHITPTEDGDWSMGPFEFYSDKILADHDDEMTDEERDLWTLIRENDEVRDFLNAAIEDHFEKNPTYMNGKRITCTSTTDMTEEDYKDADRQKRERDKRIREQLERS